MEHILINIQFVAIVTITILLIMTISRLRIKTTSFDNFKFVVSVIIGFILPITELILVSCGKELDGIVILVGMIMFIVISLDYIRRLFK